jgi:hypothetical protein
MFGLGFLPTLFVAVSVLLAVALPVQLVTLYRSGKLARHHVMQSLRILSLGLAVISIYVAPLLLARRTANLATAVVVISAAIVQFATKLPKPRGRDCAVDNDTGG